MKVFLAALVFVGLAVLLLGVNIFFFHRPFPDGEISTNPEMRKRGIHQPGDAEAGDQVREGGRAGNAGGAEGEDRLRRKLLGCLRILRSVPERLA